MNLNTRYKHHFLVNGAIFTVCTGIVENSNSVKEVKVGWAIFNPFDERWIKKVGTKLALTRMNLYPLTFFLSEDEPVMSDYISLRALELIFAVSNQKHKGENHPSSIPKETLQAMRVEIRDLVNNVSRRVKMLKQYYN